MAFREERLLGAFDDHQPDFTERGHPASMVVSGEFVQRASREAGTIRGLATGGIQSFPYADLIRKHLSNGEIFAAQRLLEFARDLIPSESKLIKALAPPRIKKSGRRDVDRRAEFRWLRLNGAKYRGQWVALVGDTLVASASTLAELLATLKSHPPTSKPLIHHLD